MVKVFILAMVIGLISVSFLSIYHYLLSSPYLRLEQVEVDGVDEKIREELIKACGLSSDVSLLGLNLNRVKHKMEGHPWVKAVSLERRFPHSLIVHVEKERPLGVVAMDKLYYFNGQGEVFKEVSRSEEVDFPLVTGVDREGAKRREQLMRAVSAIKGLEAVKGPWALNQLSEVNVKEDEMLSLYYENMGAEIRLTASALGGGMDKLTRVARHLRESGRMDWVNRIDLNYTDGVVVSFRDGIRGKALSGG